MFEELPKLPEDNPVLQSCPVRALFVFCTVVKVVQSEHCVVLRLIR